MHVVLYLLLGPYVSHRQKTLVYTTGIVFSMSILYFAYTFSLGWVWWQYIVAGVVSFDIPAGSVANNLISVKRHWQRLRKHGKAWQKIIANRIVFACLHIPYIIVMGLSFWSKMPVVFCIVMSTTLVFATIFVSHLPKSMARSGAISMVGLTMLLNIVFSPPSALWWFMPLLVVKVVNGFSTPITN